MLTNSDLWTRLKRYEIGYSNPDFSFVDRLARDNSWSDDYAARAIMEYKKFVYLALVAEQSATPSDEVDQVWHLHLLYTRDYWGDFATVLGEPLHHGPTPGGSAARANYRDAYRQTLALYQTQFGERPPADIWPKTSRRFIDPMHYRRVDTRRYRPRRSLAFAPVAKFAALAVGLAATSAVAHDSLSDNGGFLPWLAHIWESHRGFGMIVLAFAGYAVFRLFRPGSGKNYDGGCSGCTGCGGCGGCS
ncbi:MAG: hypothetical protein AB8G16_09810 [Gammaproteobacteria bacterium]